MMIGLELGNGNVVKEVVFSSIWNPWQKWGNSRVMYCNKHYLQVGKTKITYDVKVQLQLLQT